MYISKLHPLTLIDFENVKCNTVSYCSRNLFIINTN